MLTYLIQMIACSGVLYAYYYFFLRNEQFHQYNRVYLLLSMLLSLTLPLLKIPVDIGADNSASSIIYAFAGTSENITIAGNRGSSYLNVLYIVYLVPVIILLARFILSIRRIILIRKASVVEPLETIELVNTHHTDAPFSFFNWLFWNNSTDKQSVEGRQMLQHELYHIRSKHSWDLVFLELVLAACWFNPFFYLYRKEIKTVQEFLADRYATANSNTMVYAELLLLRAMGVRHQQLVNPFFHHQIKRRIVMLTSSKKPVYQGLRKLSTIPLLLLTATIAVISCNSAEEKGTPSVLTDSSATIETTDLPEPATGAPVGEISETLTPVEEKAGTNYENKDQPNNEVPIAFSRVEVDARYPGNWRSFLEKKLDGKVAVDNGAEAGTYTTITQFVVDVKGNISDVKALTNVGYGMEQEAIRVIKQSGKWTPAMMNGKPVKAYRKQPITFQITDV